MGTGAAAGLLNAVLLVARPGRGTGGLAGAGARLPSSRPGRTRDVRWGPRTLDVDVIAVDDTTSTDPDAAVAASAGRRAGLRAGALARVDPGARLGGARVVDLLEALPPEDILAVQMCGDVVL